LVPAQYRYLKILNTSHLQFLRRGYTRQHTHGFDHSLKDLYWDDYSLSILGYHH